MASLLDEAAAPVLLCSAWEVIRANDAADGAPSIGVIRFGDDLTGQIDAISMALRERRYRPSGLTEIAVPKANGGVRHLRIPSVRDRVVERALLGVLSPRLDPWFSPWSFAYRPGLGVDDAISHLVGWRDDGEQWVARADIADCFDRVDRSRLLRTLAAWCDPATIALIERLLSRPSRRAGGRRWDWNGSGTAQGAPLSPLFANLFLDRLDRGLVARGVPTIRYGDDLATTATSRDGAQRALDMIREGVHSMGMELNADKTGVVSFEEGFPYLGRDLGPHDPVASDAEIERPERKAVYVTLQGAGVHVRKGQLRVMQGQEERLAVPLAHVGQVVCFGSVGISAGLREQALLQDIEVTLCSRFGSYRGRLDGVGRHRVALRRRQYALGPWDETVQQVARAMVAGKIANQAALLARYARRGDHPTVSRAITTLRKLRHRVAAAPNRAALMGVEGAAARSYFHAWPALLPDGVRFAGRSLRPPKDLVNAALSFGYTLLTGNAVAAVAGTGLDPAVGVLHAEEDGRPSLALDLMEEFRPVVIDAMVIEAFRRRVLVPEHGTSSPDGKGVWLGAEGRARALGRFEERMLTLFAHTPSRRRVSYRRALHLQARQVAAAVAGVGRYEAIRWR